MTPPTSPQGSAPNLHYILTYDPSGRIRCEVSRDVTQIRLPRGIPFTALDEQAVNPPTTRIIINIPGYSRWAFEVTNPRGVTVRDVLVKICETMKYRVGNPEFNSFDKPTRDAATFSFHQRGQIDQTAFAQGLQRFDFLRQGKFFIGLTRGRESANSWDASFAPRTIGE